jgi:hypothetical protein
MFMGVIQSVVVDTGRIIKVIVNLDSSQTTILRLMGKECKNYYGLNLKLRNTDSLLDTSGLGTDPLPILI